MQAQEFDRRSGLGASESATAVGQSPYESPLGLYLRKVGQMPPVEENRAMRFGKHAEPFILSEFEQMMGRPVLGQQDRIHHPDHPWLWATIDGRLSEEELVEAKTAGLWTAKEFGEEDTDEVPAQYLLQASVQMACAGASVVWLPVLIAGGDVKRYRIERNDRLLDNLLPMLAEFWARVENRDPPEPDWGHASTPDLISALYPPRPGLEIEVGDDVARLVEELEAAKANAKTWKTETDSVKAHIIERLGTASVGRLKDGREITRKEVERKGYSVPACTFVDFHILKAKKVKAKA